MKIIKKGRRSIRIGVSSLRESGIFPEFIQTNNAVYMYSSTGEISQPSDTKFKFGRWTKYGEKFKYFEENDTISIILDLKKQQINYLRNGGDQGIAHKNIQKNNNITYRLLVVIQLMDDSVEITNHETTIIFSLFS